VILYRKAQANMTHPSTERCRHEGSLGWILRTNENRLFRSCKSRFSMCTGDDNDSEHIDLTGSSDVRWKFLGWYPRSSSRDTKLLHRVGSDWGAVRRPKGGLDKMSIDLNPWTTQNRGFQDATAIERFGSIRCELIHRARIVHYIHHIVQLWCAFGVDDFAAQDHCQEAEKMISCNGSGIIGKARHRTLAFDRRVVKSQSIDHWFARSKIFGECLEA
jgi:hypothetical protein